MAQLLYKSIISLLMLCAISRMSLAQSPQSCPAASSMINVNLTQFSGIWYEVARYPAPSSTMECIQFNFTVLPDGVTLNIQLTYSNMPSMLYMNTTDSANITLSNNPNGYNVSFTSGSTSTPVTTIKLLDTNYTNYAFICGYTNQSDPTTSFSAVLTRMRVPIQTDLTTYENMASDKYMNFSNSSMTNITQTDQCYNSGASTVFPMITAIFAAIFAFFNYF